MAITPVSQPREVFGFAQELQLDLMDKPFSKQVGRAHESLRILGSLAASFDMQGDEYLVECRQAFAVPRYLNTPQVRYVHFPQIAFEGTFRDFSYVNIGGISERRINALSSEFNDVVLLPEGEPLPDDMSFHVPVLSMTSQLVTAGQMAAIKVIYEDNDVLVIDKPAGISVHGGVSVTGKTVADYFKDKINDPDIERPGIVHRLDKDTSGVMILAKNSKAKKYLQKQFKAREVEKTYVALVKGRPRHPEAILDWPVGRNPKNPLKQAVIGTGKPATSHYKTIQTFDNYTLLEVWPKTGRMHQIRVHLAHLGNPIVGDKTYGKPEPNLGRQFLHAKQLEIILPNKKKRVFNSSLPKELDNFLQSINS